jgi:hypothetical protein
VTERDELMDQLYGLLEDWKARDFGGDTIVEALEKLIAVIGSSPATSHELEKIRVALERLADAVESQPDALTEAGAVELRPAGVTTPAGEDRAAEARDVIHRNVAELAERMSWRTDPTDDPLSITAPPAAAPREIVPSAVLPGSDASLYGAGLTAVRGIFVDGSRATIRRRLPGEVAFEVPSDVSDGDVEVRLADGEVWRGSVDVIQDVSSRYASTREERGD